jgi:hypothetical protein
MLALACARQRIIRPYPTEVFDLAGPSQLALSTAMTISTW